MSGTASFKMATSTSQVALSANDELAMSTPSSTSQPNTDPNTGLRQLDVESRQYSAIESPGAAGGVVGEVDDSVDDLRCGWLGCRPAWLQRFNKAPWVLVSLCFATLLQGMIVNGFPPSAITSIERRFQLSSRDTGILISVYDATNIVFVLFVVYVGGRQNKFRWVGVGCLLLSISSFMFALPHFTTPPYSYSGGNVSSGSATCTHISIGGSDDTSCDSDVVSTSTVDGSLMNYIYLFCASQVVAGFGSLPLYTLGLAALDESVSNKSYGPYFGIFFAVAVMGPGLGFILAGTFLNMFTELSHPEGVTLSPADPGWVGAWWLGFVICGAVVLLVAIPLTMFPKELPTTATIRAEKAVQAHANAGLDETTRAGFGKKPSDLLRALKYLFVNPTFIFTCLGGTADSLLINAFNSFLPKLLENQFSLTSGIATILTGIVGICGGIVGSLGGGFILRRLGLDIRGSLKLIGACNFASGCLFLVVFWYCPQSKLAGVTTSYDGTELAESHNANTTWTCNADCSCSDDQFLPVCAQDDGVTYFTSCHAGCGVDYGNGTFTDCTCLQSSSSKVESGLCGIECTYQPYIFVLVCSVTVMFIFFSQILELNVILRCVPDTQRSMALGVSSLLKRALGSVPGPIMFGVVIDQACILWQDTCGTSGSCWIYDNWSLGWRISVIAVSLKLIGCAMYLFSLLFYRPADPAKGKSEKPQ